METNGRNWPPQHSANRPSSRRLSSIVVTAIFERTTQKYRDRGIRYVYMEAGHAAQNVCLQAVSLDLGTVVIGAFSDDQVKEVMQLMAMEEPLYIIPVGKRRR